MQHKHTNHLIHETSPYLLQHAHNPVNWYPWSEEALQKAKAENKPILVSIGYAACHWCHVMERESFENESVAALMNEFFINIKVDREERPDLDHIYMDAVQAIAGNGGWPLNVFLTPDRKPFYGGTYFPPKPMYNRASWQQVIEAIHQSYEEKPDEIQQQANNLIEHLLNANNIGAKKKIDGGLYTADSLTTIAENILQSADTVWGGFGHAPKFPQTLSIQYLLRHYYFTGDEAAIKQALLSIDKMLQGGIYDQLGGGLARYSTDEEWLAPHFEKMLYDNALLLNVLSEAFQLTKETHYEKAIAHIIAFIEREWLHPEGGTYSALDADSEGVEGKYYTWNKAEIEAVLQEDAALFCKIYDVTDEGNWEHTNILRLLSSIPEAAKELGLQEDVLEQKMIECDEKLLAQREKRIKPLLDDKIILGWNALLVRALCKAYAATGIAHYLQLAEKNCSFIEEKFYKKEKGRWFHTWKNDEAKYPAFLDDLSYLVQAYIHLQEVTGNTIYLTKAKALTEYVIENYSDEENTLFYYTPAFQTDIVMRKKETYDGATPSGNATMCHNLLYLSVVFDVPEWKEHSLQMLSSLDKAIVRYTTSFGEWASAIQMAVYGLNEIAIVGADSLDFLAETNRHYIPNKIVMSANKENIHFPLLKDKTSSDNQTYIYLCKDYACLRPVQSLEALMDLVIGEDRQ